MVDGVAGRLDILSCLQSFRILCITGTELLIISTAMTDFDGKLCASMSRDARIYEKTFLGVLHDVCGRENHLNYRNE